MSLFSKLKLALTHPSKRAHEGIAPDVPTLKRLMRDCIAPKGGDVSARTHAVELGMLYLEMNAEGKLAFFTTLASEFDIDREALARLLAGYAALANDNDRSAHEAKIRIALITPRNALLKQFTALPEGFKFLVNLRADLLPLLLQHPELQGVEDDLQAILSAWFDIGLLDLVEITWEKTPSVILEKLMQYEAVHAIGSWDDLRNRLDTDRKVYAFFHNKMPTEPLIFVQVAFVKGMASSIQTLLDTKAAALPIKEADSAVFYSISNAQKGLSGISFGNFLIKRVVEVLMREYPHIKHIATLSPIPGFMAWLEEALNAQPALLTPQETKALQAFGSETPAECLRKLLHSNWVQDTTKERVLTTLLLRLCAHYLLHEKKGKKPRDPVANFHLFNGARIERINAGADVSAKGLKQSAGLMVNYYYALDEIDENHEAFVREGTIAASKQLRTLAGKP